METWYRGFYRYMQSCSTPVEDYTTFLVTFLDPVAADHVIQGLTLKGHRDYTTSDIEVARDVLFDAYVDVSKSKQAALTLHRTKQGADTAQAYMHSFAIKLGCIKPEHKLAEWQVVEHFIQGFNSTRLRETLQQMPDGGPPSTYSEERLAAQNLLRQSSDI